MNNSYSKNFLVGLLIGTLAFLLYWYWQKSTQAEDGALELLDKLKVAQDRLTQAPLTVEQEDLTKINGIGPVFAQRLYQADINTTAQVAMLSPQQLADTLNIQLGRAAQILANMPK